jgi:hypothetical protein
MSNLAVPSPVFPEAARILNVGREIVAPGTQATTYVSVPVADFQPDPDLNYFFDNALRGSLTGPYDAEEGPAWVPLTIPESPVYGDTIGYFLSNLFGEWTDAGTSQSTTWTATGGVSAGAGPITVTSGTVASSGTYIQIGTTGATEVVEVGTGSTATSIVINAATPIRFNHTGSTTITLVAGPYTHVFATMNPSSPTGVISGQGPSHTILDRNQAAGAGAYYADAYPYSCMQEITLTGMPNGYLTWSAKLISWPQAAPLAAVTAAFSGAKGIPAWLGSSTIGGSAANNVDKWTVTLTRELNPVPMINGQQAPLIIARGKLTGTFENEYAAITNESALNYMLNNTQPSLLWTTANGLSGTSELSFSVAANLGAATKAPLKAIKTLFGYDVTGTLIGNTSNVGPSGGYGAAAITLINNVPCY